MKRTQTGWVFIIVILIIILTVIIQTRNIHLSVFILAFSLIVLLIFHKLTIHVTDEYVKFYFGIGLIGGKYRLSDVINCKPVSYFSMGWGIRFKPGVILFNVSGNKAIELEIKNKSRKIWIGTNFPEEIADYINKCRYNHLEGVV